MKIVVLAGGTSTERAVSIVSGTKVTEALRTRGHRAVLIDVFCGVDDLPQDHFPEIYDVEAAAAYMRSFDDRLEQLKSRREFFGPHVMQLCREAEVVFMALHGQNGEDGKIQAAFDLMGIAYTGSNYLGSALAMDKDLSKILMEKAGIAVPPGIVVHKGDRVLDTQENGVGLPCIVKPACGGSSVGVSTAYTEEEYAKALQEGFAYEDVLLVEKFISGREFSVGVIDEEVYPVIEIAPLQGFYDYTNKYKAGSTVETCPAELSEEKTRQIQDQALAAYHALGLSSYGRMDIMMDQDGATYVLEANTLPGMTPTSLLPQEAAAVGLDFPHLCEKLIRVSLKDRK